MTTPHLTYGDPQFVAEWLEQTPSDQISQEDLVSALINALNRIAQLERERNSHLGLPSK